MRPHFEVIFGKFFNIGFRKVFISIFWNGERHGLSEYRTPQCLQKYIVIFTRRHITKDTTQRLSCGIQPLPYLYDNSEEEGMRNFSTQLQSPAVAKVDPESSGHNTEDYIKAS